MKVSDRCIDLIKKFEGYGRKLPDGSCTAYQEKINGKIDKPTIGWGCTRNVKMGDVWTVAQAEAALRSELEIHEKRVERLVTVDLNQNQFDSLVSLDYNCGGLTTEDGKPSWVLKFLNAEKYELAAGAMLQWNKFGGKPAKALIARRAAERALFLEPVGDVDVSYMPQAAEKAPAISTADKIKVVASVATGGGVGVASHSVPGVPDVVSQGIASAQAWQGIGSQASDLLGWVIAKPLISLPLVAVMVLVGWVLPWFARRNADA